ncbi:hypothetical protein [Sphingomonas hankookensis]|uniref:hypothetical protein n=1 Tax=Sphingomonas hankookensis TaxID=563996 RepID=UPI003D303231
MSTEIAARGLVALTPDEHTVLMQMSGDVGYRAALIAANLDHEQPEAGWTPKRVTDLRRSLHGKGYAEYGPLMSEDDNLWRGRGYWLSPAGCDLRYGRREA